MTVTTQALHLHISSMLNNNYVTSRLQYKELNIFYWSWTFKLNINELQKWLLKLWIKRNDLVYNIQDQWCQAEKQTGVNKIKRL